MTLPAGARLGPYEIASSLGAGGMGEVYRAHDPRLGRDVAIKVLPAEVAADADPSAGSGSSRASARDDRLARFAQEARAVAALNHPHILTVHDVGTAEGGTPYVVTELLEGETLREVLARRTPTWRQVVGWGVQVAQGLGAAHQKGIVHRDLKPENLFLTTDGRIKILDFGLAKLTAPVALDAATALAGSPTRPGLLVGTVPYLAPEQVRGEAVDGRTDLFALGVVLDELLTRRHPFARAAVGATLSAILEETPAPPSTVNATLPRALDGIVRRCLAKEREARYGTAQDLARALEAVLAAPAGAVALEEVEERSPYPGLLAFTEQDAGVFFGREAEVTALWTRIRARRLLAVIGPSGAGKTSFLRAGVLPARPAGWSAIVATPGTAPLRGLGRQLGPELAGDAEALGQLAGFDDPEVAFTLLSRWRRAHDEALLIIDQFEELFTLNPPETQARMAALLARLAHDADLHVVLSLRDDFLMRCCEQPPLAPILTELTALLAMGRDALRRAVVEPARARGYRLDDDALVDEMVECVEGSRGALPLLAFAVARLWEERDRTRKLLTREAYEASGGVAGALAQNAEATLDRIGSMQQDVVRELFRNLVTAHGTRAVMDREELLSAFPDRAAAEGVLRALIDARLLTTYEIEGHAGEPTHHRVEVVHESLLKAWPRLVRWQAQEEEGAVLRDQLKQAAHLWAEKGRTADLLWTGTAYYEYALWRGRYPGALTALEEDFARAMADRARRQKRVRTLIVGTVVAAAVVVAAITGALWRRSEAARAHAQAEARRAEASKLLALAQLWLEEDPTEALAYSTASLELADTREARVFAMKVLTTAPPAFVLPAGAGLRGAFFNLDGTQLAVGGHAPEVRVWREDGQGPIVLPGHQVSDAGAIRGEWADGGILVTGVPFVQRLARVWSLPGTTLRRTIDFGGPTWWKAGREQLFAQTVESGTREKPRVILLRSWRLPDGEAEVLGRIDLVAESISSSIAFDPSGKGFLYTRGRSIFYRPGPRWGNADILLARHDAEAKLGWTRNHYGQLWSHDASGEIRLWSFTTDGPKHTKTFRAPDTAPSRFLVDPSGRWLASSVDENEARVWDLAAWPAARPLRLRRRASWAWAENYFHPRGDWLVTSLDLSDLVFWPLNGVRPAVVDGCTAAEAAGVHFSSDGRWLVSNWADSPSSPAVQAIRLWPVPGSGAVPTRRLDLPENIVWSLPLPDPHRRFLFVLGNPGGAGPEIGFVVPLDGSARRELAKVPEDTMSAIEPAISLSGRLAATAYFYGEGKKLLRIWTLGTGEVRDYVLPVPQAAPETDEKAKSAHSGYNGGINSLAFQDETTLWTAGDGGIRRWNLTTGSHELVLASPPGRTATMVLGADNRTALTLELPLGPTSSVCGPVAIVDLSARRARPLEGFGDCVTSLALHPSGAVAATGDGEGIVRVGRVAGGTPQLLMGHERGIRSVALSPDLRWVASIGHDATLRLWPMPDLSKPALHTLPLDQLLAKLKPLTNLRVVRNAASSTGWKVEIGPFPGWKDVPTW